MSAPLRGSQGATGTTRFPEVTAGRKRMPIHPPSKSGDRHSSEQNVPNGIHRATGGPMNGPSHYTKAEELAGHAESLIEAGHVDALATA